MYIIVGLGNPGKEYVHTPHNAGFLALDACELEWKHDKYLSADVAFSHVDSHEILYMKPDTFMNNSGDVVPLVLRRHNVSHNEWIVVYDDIDLPLGVIKISFDRGDGGHNGVKSMASALGSKEFTRVRVGVSRKLDDDRIAKPNVTAPFNQDDLQKLSETVARVPEILKTIIKEGREKAMTKYN